MLFNFLADTKPEIEHLLPEQISLQSFDVDFEAAIWIYLFPGFVIQGFAFHWTQAVFRKVLELGLQVNTIVLIDVSIGKRILLA